MEYQTWRSFTSLFVLTHCGWLKSAHFKGMEGNFSKPFRVGTNEVALSHFQFVDNMGFCFGNWEFLNLNHMVGFFRTYQV